MLIKREECLSWHKESRDSWMTKGVTRSGSGASLAHKECPDPFLKSVVIMSNM